MDGHSDGHIGIYAVNGNVVRNATIEANIVGLLWPTKTMKIAGRHLGRVIRSSPNEPFTLGFGTDHRRGHDRGAVYVSPPLPSPRLGKFISGRFEAN
jgi:putative cofactor-binding repeat protein